MRAPSPLLVSPRRGAQRRKPNRLDLKSEQDRQPLATAYDWPADLSDEQILERLLALNLERAAEEAKAQQSPNLKPAQRHKAEHEMI